MNVIEPMNVSTLNVNCIQVTFNCALMTELNVNDFGTDRQQFTPFKSIDCGVEHTHT